MSQKKAAKRKILGGKELKSFLDVWREYAVKLRSSKRNSHVISKMQGMLKEEHSIELTAAEIKNRIQNLSKKYRDERKHIQISGGSPSNWDQYEIVHGIIGGYQSNFSNEITDETIENKSIDLWNGAASIDGPESIESPLSSSICSPLPSSPSPTANPTFPETVGRTSSSSSKVAKKKQEQEEKLEALLNREVDLFEKFVNKCIETDNIKIELLKQNNDLLAKLLEKT